MLKVTTFCDGTFSGLSCHEPFSIQFVVDLTLRFDEHRNGEGLVSMRENLCQHLDVGARFIQAAS
jgi:hypothetical protein